MADERNGRRRGRGVRLAMLAAMGAMFGVALTVPGATSAGRHRRGGRGWRLAQLQGLDLHRLALHAYSYLNLPMVAGTVLFALGLKTTLGGVGEELDAVPAFALCGGAALYLLGHVAFLFRTTGRIFRRRARSGRSCWSLVPVALAIQALAALALVSAVCSLVVAYEVIRYREHRVRVRHPEVAA